MKKILTGMIVVLSIFISSVALADNTTDETVRLLENLGIYTEEDGMNELDELLSRERMAAILSSFYGVERNGSIHEFASIVENRFYLEGSQWIF